MSGIKVKHTPLKKTKDTFWDNSTAQVEVEVEQKPEPSNSEYAKLLLMKLDKIIEKLDKVIEKQEK